MSRDKQKILEKKYNFKSDYMEDFKVFRNEIIKKEIIPYQVEFQAPPRGKKNMLVRMPILLWIIC